MQLPESVFAPDKLGHFLAYALLAGLSLWALARNGQLSLRSALWTVALVSCYGVALEYVQLLFFPSRYFEVWDMFANFTGASASLLAFKYLTNKA